MDEYSLYLPEGVTLEALEAAVGGIAASDDVAFEGDE